jgi:hypothetical protein
VEVHELPFFITRARASTEFVSALEPGEAGVLEKTRTLVIRTADGAIAVERAVLGLDLDDEQGGGPDDDAQDLTLTEQQLAHEISARLRF